MARLGIILPDDGPADYEWLHAEDWLARYGASDLDLRVVRTRRIGGHEREALFHAGSLETLRPPARRLAEAGCDTLVWACTSGSFIGGFAWARRQAEAIENLTGLPVTSATLAMIAATQALGRAPVDVLATYPQPITAAFVSCLDQAGITVDTAVSLGAPDGAASFSLDIRAEAARFAARHRIDRRPLLVPDTAVDTLGLIEELEAVTGRPVVTANQACLWHGMTLVRDSRAGHSMPEESFQRTPRKAR